MQRGDPLRHRVRRIAVIDDRFLEPLETRARIGVTNSIPSSLRVCTMRSEPGRATVGTGDGPGVTLSASRARPAALGGGTRIRRAEAAGGGTSCARGGDRDDGRGGTRGGALQERPPIQAWRAVICGHPRIPPLTAPRERGTKLGDRPGIVKGRGGGRSPLFAGEVAVLLFAERHDAEATLAHQRRIGEELARLDL